MKITNNFGCTLNFHSLYFSTLLLACLASTSRSPVCWAGGNSLIKNFIFYGTKSDKNFSVADKN